MMIKTSAEYSRITCDVRPEDAGFSDRIQIQVNSHNYSRILIYLSLSNNKQQNHMSSQRAYFCTKHNCRGIKDKGMITSRTYHKVYYLKGYHHHPRLHVLEATGICFHGFKTVVANIKLITFNYVTK